MALPPYEGPESTSHHRIILEGRNQIPEKHTDLENYAIPTTDKALTHPNNGT